MGRYHAPVAATRIDLIAPPVVHPHCHRCGMRFHDARRSTIYCADCRTTLAFEQRAGDLGVDLAELDEDEFLEIKGRRSLPRQLKIVREEQVA